MANDITARGLAATAESGVQVLTTEVNALKNIGKFLSLWDCSTGLPITAPSTVPYNYATGDYYRIGTVPSSGNVYIPSGTSYTGAASTTTTTETLNNKDIYFFDGTQWVLQKSNLKDTTWKEFPVSWKNKSSASEFFSAVYATNPSVGEGYLGPITWQTGMPFSGNAEITLTVSATGVYLVTLTSSNVYPYHWEMTAIGSTPGAWRSWAMNPMTTAGDLIVGGSNGTPTRLGKGTTGQVLKSTANGVEWSDRIPTVTIAVSQVISQNPVTVQMTSEQQVIFEDASIGIIRVDVSALGIPGGTIQRGTEYTNVIQFVGDSPLYGVDNVITHIGQNLVVYNKTSKQAILSDMYLKQELPSTLGTAGKVLKVNSAGTGLEYKDNVVEKYTTAPTEANTDGLKFVVLSSEPATKYDGWVYIITGA